MTDSRVTTPTTAPSGYTRPALRGTPPATPRPTPRAAPKRRGISLALKIFLGTALVIAAALGGALFATSRSAERAADEAVTAALAATREQISTTLAGRERAITDAAQVFVQNPTFRSIVESRDRSNVYDQTLEAVEQTGADWVQIVDDQGVRLAKSDDAAAAADTLGGALIGGALEGAVTSGFGVAGDTALLQTLAVPVQGAGRTVGALMAVRPVGGLADSIKSVTGSEVLFYAVGNDERPHVAGATLPPSADRDRVLAAFAAPSSADTAQPRVDVTIGGTHYVGNAQTLRSAGGGFVGGFIALRNRDQALGSFLELRRTILYAGAVGLLAAFVLSFLIARQITRPVAALVAATRQAADGDYGADISVRSRDEIGTLADAFRAMLTDLRDKQALVEVLMASDADRTVPMQAALSGTAMHAAKAMGVIEPGQTFGNRYEIKEVLGVGGMGMVYKAMDRELHEVLALKTLKPDIVARDPQALDRFKSEIRLARRIAHRNVVRTYDLGEIGGTYYISMEYVEGKSLKDLIRSRTRLPVPVTLTIARQLARALEAAHEQGVIHRDVKPQNMIVEPDGVLKVMDFGIARLAATGAGAGLTQAGMVIGTPDYMAPEQLLGEDVDARADVYAAGCVIYECLVGRVPLVADTPITLITKVLEEVPARPRTLNADVPPLLDALVMRCLAKDRSERPNTAAVLYDLLVEIENAR